MAALAITDTADGRRILALTGRLDATTLPELWDKARRAADEAAAKPSDRRRVRHRVLRRRRRRALRRAPAPPPRGPRRGRESQADVRSAAQAVRPGGARARPRSGAAAPARGRGGRFRDVRPVARHPHADRVHRRDDGGARVRRALSEERALEGRLADLRAGGRRRAADRRAHLGAARDDPRVPVGGADEALRRGDLRRRPDRPVDAARARPVDDGDPARRPLRARRSPPRSGRCASTRRSTR